MAECAVSDILKNKMRKNEHVRVQTSSGATYDGTIDSIDCLGVLFIPKDRKEFDPAYILYSDIKKFMLPEH